MVRRVVRTGASVRSPFFVGGSTMGKAPASIVRRGERSGVPTEAFA